MSSNVVMTFKVAQFSVVLAYSNLVSHSEEYILSLFILCENDLKS